MPTVEEDIRSTLFADPTVGGQVGSTAATARIHFGVLPQDTAYPAIQIDQITAIRSHNVAGGPATFNNTTYQLDCWETSYGKAKTLANNVKAALDGVTTPFAMLLDTERDLYDSQARVHRIALDFTVMTEASSPAYIYRETESLEPWPPACG